MVIDDKEFECEIGLKSNACFCGININFIHKLIMEKLRNKQSALYYLMVLRQK